MSQVPEESYTLAEYRNTFKKRFEFTAITVLGSDANGTHFQWDDARGERHFGVISDLIGFPVVRAGSTNVTIPASGAAAETNQVLTPALTGSIADYIVLVGQERPSAGFSILTTAFIDLTTLSNLRVRVGRNPVLSHTATNTDLTILDSIDVGLTNPHQHDEVSNPGLGHLHTQVAIPAHLNTGQAQTIYTVFWAIIRV